MAADASIKANISGDASGLIAALEQAKQGVAKFGSDAANVLNRKLGLKDVFKGVLQGIGIASVGQIADKLVGPYKAAAEAAEDIAKSTERAANATERLIALRQTDNQQLATAEKTLARMQRLLESKKSEGPSKSFFGGLIQRGSAFDKLLGLSSGEDNARAKEIAALTADIGEQAVKVEEKTKSVKKQTTDADIKAAKDSLEAIGKQKEAAKKLAEFERESKIENASGEAKINLLQEDRRKVMADIAKYENFVREGGELFKDGLDDLLNLKTKQRDLEKEIADLTIKKASDEKVISNEIQKQNDMRAAMAAQATENTLFIGNKAYGASRSPEEIKRASDQELQEFVKRQKAEIQSIEGGKGRGPGALADAATNFLLQGTVIARLQTDVMRALSEINMRSGLKKDLDLFGEAGARSRFGGDALAFDKLVQEFVTDSRSSKEIGAQSNRLLEDIKRRLDGGILTLPTNVIKGGG